MGEGGLKVVKNCMTQFIDDPKINIRLRLDDFQSQPYLHAPEIKTRECSYESGVDTCQVYQYLGKPLTSKGCCILTKLN